MVDRDHSPRAAAFSTTSGQLPDLPVQYADFAVWQREWLSGDGARRSAVVLAGALADLPALEFPADRPRPQVRSSAGAILDFEIPAAVAEGLRALSRTAGASMFMTLLAAFTVLLSRYSGQDDVVVGTPIAGRNRAEIEGLIGFFVNTLVLRTDLSGDPTFAELLGRVRATTLGRVRASGSAVRAARRCARSGAGPIPHAAVPGVVRLLHRGRATKGRWAGRAAGRDSQVRPAADCERDRARAVGRRGVQHGAVR